MKSAALGILKLGHPLTKITPYLRADREDIQILKKSWLSRFFP